MIEPLKVWRSPLVEEGAQTAIYPYNQLREILQPSDCRCAIIDETSALEAEFGAGIADPLYELLWTINSGAGVFTSHTVMAKPGHKPPYEWAKHYIGVAIIILSRNKEEHASKDAVLQSVDELGRIISANKPPMDYTGWYLSVGPCNVIYTPDMILTTFHAPLPADTRGYGTELVIGGAAGNRRNAAERWKNAVMFVNAAIKRTQQGPSIMPALPHRHAIPGALPSE